MSYSAHSSAIIDEPCRIGNGTRIWHFSHIMSDCVIGENCNFGQNVFVASGVIIGNGVKVQNNVSIYEGVICEDDVFLGPSVVFTNILNPRSAITRKGQYEKTLIKKGATIGANATIVCGIEIGNYAFVGAGTVVVESVLPYALVVGNPAKQIGWVSEFGCKLAFNKEGIATCENSRQRYRLEQNSIKKLENGA